MPTRLGPWDVGFPVRFRANGDTVHDAFYKHIQEIERIYGLLNALDANKLDAADLAAHVNSPNPHPNLTLDGSKITGVITNATIPIDNVTGNIPASRIYGLLVNATIDIANVIGNIMASRIYGLLTNATININNVIGNIPANRIYGFLVNATIDVSNVIGLSNLINNAAQPIESENSSPNGYVKFKGGFMIQWGESGVYTHSDEAFKKMTFPTAFSQGCFAVLVTIHSHNITNAARMDKTICIGSDSVSKTGFDVSIQETTGDTGGAEYSAQYIAIGY